MEAHLFGLKRTAFVLWRPHQTELAPKLVIGQFQPGNPPVLVNRREFDLQPMPEHTDLWGIGAEACNLMDGQVFLNSYFITTGSR